MDSEYGGVMGVIRQCLADHRSWFLTGFMMLLCLLPDNKARAESSHVIVHSDQSSVQLSPQSLWAIYGMKTRSWPDGSRIKVFVLPSKHPQHRGFAIQVLKTYPYQLERVWQRLMYSGTGRAPTEVESEQAMIEAVSSTPGAIGYINAATDKGASHVIEIQ
ncbi:hypothetical protein [Amphritea sp. HPY]|uniref:hypothetical protein n=1 Tax=Amphritea sp. HPY TaxID=3421652 RepID=UPI003D7DC4C5